MPYFLNTSNEAVHTEVAVTIRADPPEDVPVHAAQIFMNTLSSNVPPFSKGGATVNCGVPKDINLFRAASHMHQHGGPVTGARRKHAGDVGDDEGVKAFGRPRQREVAAFGEKVSGAFEVSQCAMSM